MLMTYLDIGISYLLGFSPIAFIAICIFYGIKFLITKKIDFKLKNILCEFGWILIVLTILAITGILEGIFGGTFGNTSIFDGNVCFSFILFEDGISIALLLNIILFIPFGFLSSAVFKNLRGKWTYGVLIGLAFSIIIEFIQSFCGRFVQLDDILMNTLGTFIGYEIYNCLLKLKEKKKVRIV